MRIFIIGFVLCLLGLPLLLLGAAYLAISDRPAIAREAAFTPADIQRAEAILAKHDPRRIKAGARRTLQLSQGEADLTLSYLAGRYAKTSTRITLQSGVILLATTTPLPIRGPGGYLNVEAALRGSESLLAFESLRVGRLSVPAWFANMMLKVTVARLSKRAGFSLVVNTIKQISIAGDQLNITYDWQRDTVDNIRTAILPPADQARLQVYQTHLAETLAAIKTPPANAKVTLSELLIPLFKLASERSNAGDPAAENRAALVVLAFYVNGKGLDAIVPAAREWSRPATRTVLLAGRDDFSKHFATSAALAANAGAALADVIGLYKEVRDSRGGSGFSFNDIAADRAGTRLGELAVGNRESALNIQRMVTAGVSDKDLMPPFADLPELMPEAEFKRRYGGIGAPAYKAMMDEIERRIAALPLLR